MEHGAGDHFSGLRVKAPEGNNCGLLGPTELFSMKAQERRLLTPGIMERADFLGGLWTDYLDPDGL